MIVYLKCNSGNNESSEHTSTKHPHNLLFTLHIAESYFDIFLLICFLKINDFDSFVAIPLNIYQFRTLYHCKTDVLSPVFKLVLITVKHRMNAVRSSKYWLGKNLATSVDCKLQSKQNHMPLRFWFTLNL